MRVRPSPDVGLPADVSGPGGNILTGLVRVCRPRQLLKNVLVFAAPGAAGVLTHRTVALHALAAFGIFCLASSGTYLINDALDVAADRLHPEKQHRPIAAGHVPAVLASTLGAIGLAAAVALSALASGWHLAIVIAIYAVVTTAYSLGLKHEPVLELLCVSSGFVLRAIAGGVATKLSLSVWFLIVASFGSLLVVTGKRSAEKVTLGPGSDATRSVLQSYPLAFLRSVRVMASSVTVTAYCLWAFNRAAQLGHRHHPIWFELSIIPFVLAVMVVELRFELGKGSAPDDLAFRDHTLQVAGIIWVALVFAGVYA